MHIQDMEKELHAEFSRSRVFRPGHYFLSYDHPDVPAVTCDEPHVVTTRQWGLIPFWAKDRHELDKIRVKATLARAETVMSSRLFRESFERRRCLMLATGFFEWQHRGREKIPFYIYGVRPHELFTVAAIHDRWTDRETGELLETCAMITVEANRFWGAIHNSQKRMPAIIEADLRSQWLDAGLAADEAHEMLKPYREDGLRAHTISKLISSRVPSEQKNVPELTREVQLIHEPPAATIFAPTFMDIQTFADFKTRYKFDENITVGTGGFAAVYKGLDSLTGRTVAIKKSLVNPDRQKYSLYEEVQRGKVLRHPNLVEYLEVYRFASDHGTFDYGVLEYVNGGTLSDFLKTEPSQTQIKSVLLGILDGLKYLHDNSIIHRDLKPSNVLIHYEGGRYIPKIIDFGISKGLTSEESTVSNIVGSWQYMSPEQISPLPGERIRTNSDLWSFGVIVYEVFTGKSAFGSTKSGDTSERIRGRILDGNLPEDVITVPQPYQSVIRQCLVKDPGLRVSKAEQVIGLINNYNPEEVTISSQKTEVSSPVQPPQPPVQQVPPVQTPPRPQPQVVSPVMQQIPVGQQGQRANWWQPALVITALGVILSFFLPMIKDNNESSAFNGLKALAENPDMIEFMTAEAWLLEVSYALIAISGILLLISGIKGGRGFGLGLALLIASVAYISYQYNKLVTDFGGTFSDFIKGMGIGYWIPLVASIGLIIMRFAAGSTAGRPAVTSAPPPVSQSYPQPQYQPVHQPAQAPVVSSGRKRFPLALKILIPVVLIGGGGAAAGWFLTDGYTRMPFGEKSKEELIIGSWKMYQIFEDLQYRDLEGDERITVEFHKNGTISSSLGEANPYRISGDRLIIAEEEPLIIRSLDDQNLRLSSEDGSTEMSFRRI